MRKVAATRGELLARKEQIELAKQGQSLLDEKRSALLKEAMTVIDRVMQRSEELERLARAARIALLLAEARAGREAVQSASYAARGDLQLEIETINVMGVRLPAIEQKSVQRSSFSRGYSTLNLPIAIDDAAGAFEAEVGAILGLADSELRLRRVTEEIGQITRRVNALEQVLIPRLEEEKEHIEMKLQEREREENFRLRLLKRRKTAA